MTKKPYYPLYLSEDYLRDLLDIFYLATATNMENRRGTEDQEARKKCNHYSTVMKKVRKRINHILKLIARGEIVGLMEMDYDS